MLEFQKSLLGRSIPFFLKCSPKPRNWHVLGLFPTVWPWVVGRLVGDGRKVVGSWSEGRRVVGMWSGGGRRWSRKVVGGGRKLVGNWLAVVAWRLQPGSKVVVLFELAVA